MSDVSERDLLAVIHRDGGHHTEEVGIEQSREDAMAVYYQLRSEVDEAHCKSSSSIDTCRHCRYLRERVAEGAERLREAQDANATLLDTNAELRARAEGAEAEVERLREAFRHEPGWHWKLVLSEEEDTRVPDTARAERAEADNAHLLSLIEARQGYPLSGDHPGASLLAEVMRLRDALTGMKNIAGGWLLLADAWPEMRQRCIEHYGRTERALDAGKEARDD
jgi:hypothetical protein